MHRIKEQKNRTIYLIGAFLRSYTAFQSLPWMVVGIFSPSYMPQEDTEGTTLNIRHCGVYYYQVAFPCNQGWQC